MSRHRVVLVAHVGAAVSALWVLASGGGLGWREVLALVVLAVDAGSVVWRVADQWIRSLPQPVASDRVHRNQPELWWRASQDRVLGGDPLPGGINRGRGR